MKTPAQSFFHQPINEDAYPTVTATQSDFNQFYRAWKNWAPGYVGASHSYTNITIPSSDFRGRVAHQNGFVYFFPLTAGQPIRRIDPVAKTLTSLVNTPTSGGSGANKWHGAIVSPIDPNFIYLIPYDANSVAKYSISGNSFTTFGSLSTSCCKYTNGIAYKNKIYCMPQLSVTTMLVIDCSLDTASTVAGAKTTSNHSFGTPFMQDDKIYFPPYSVTFTWRIYNILTNSFSNGPNMVAGSWVSMEAGTENWSGGLAFSNISAAATASVWRYNTTNDTVTLQFTYSATGAASNAPTYMSYGPDGSYWATLNGGGLLRTYLSSTNSATFSFDRYSSNYRYGPYALNGNLVAWTAATTIVVVENNTNWDNRSNILMSPFMNKSLQA